MSQLSDWSIKHQGLEDELARWSNAGRKIRLFLRDDDAVSDTPPLRQLIALCQRYSVPLLLAAVPKFADETLAHLVNPVPLVTGAVHGYAHQSHSPVGHKPCELDGFRPLEKVVAEMRAGRARLLALFDGRVSGLLVPPWNRIHDEVLAHVAEAGFEGVSAHGWPDASPTVKMVNVHVDIIFWSGGTVGRSPNWVDAQLAANLGEARMRGWQPIGILTHHLVHDAQAWTVLEQIFMMFSQPNAEWVTADSIIPGHLSARLPDQA
jgi:hypothetical protein